MSDTLSNFPHDEPPASSDVQARQPDAGRAAESRSAGADERHEGFEWPVPPHPSYPRRDSPQRPTLARTCYQVTPQANNFTLE